MLLFLTWYVYVSPVKLKVTYCCHQCYLNGIYFYSYGSGAYLWGVKGLSAPAPKVSGNIFKSIYGL